MKNAVDRSSSGSGARRHGCGAWRHGRRLFASLVVLCIISVPAFSSVASSKESKEQAADNSASADNLFDGVYGEQLTAEEIAEIDGGDFRKTLAVFAVATAAKVVRSVVIEVKVAKRVAEVREAIRIEDERRAESTRQTGVGWLDEPSQVKVDRAAREYRQELRRSTPQPAGGVGKLGGILVPAEAR